MCILKNLATIVAVLALNIFFPCTVLSQQTKSPPDTLKTYKLGEVIVTANRFKQKPSSVGRNVTVISQDEIKNSLHYSVGELLAEQQSIHLVGSGQTPGAIQAAFIRGTNSDNSVVLIDGVRISDPSSTDNSLNLAELSLANVQRIEIVRGSHSTLYGSSAIGGVINIITKGKKDRGFHGNLESKQGVFSGDAFTTTNSAFAGYAWENGLYLNAAGAWEDTGGMDATIDTVQNPNLFNPTDRDGFNKLDLTTKAGFKNKHWDTFISYRREDQTTQLDGGAFNDDDNAKSYFQRDLVNYKASYQLSKLFELQFSGGYSELSRDFDDDSSRVDASGNFDGSVTHTDAVASLLQNEFTAQYKTSSFVGIAGLGSSHQTMNIKTFTFVRSFNFESSADLDSLDLKETINYAFLHTELGGGLIDESLASFTLGLGGRLLHHNAFGTNATFEINPKFQLNAGSLVYGAITTGFNAPSLYQLHSPSKSFGAFTNQGNEDLDPETSVSYELGWKQQLVSSVHLNVALFHTEVKDVIEYVNLWNGQTPIASLTGADFLGDTYLNASRQHINGLEVGLDAQLTNRFSFQGDVSLTDAKLSFSEKDIDEDQTGGNHVQVFEGGSFVSREEERDGLTRRPSFSGNFRVNYQPADRLSLSLSSRFVGSRDDIGFNAALGPYGAQSFNKVGSYNLTDIGIRYKLSNVIALNFKAKNIFDEKYMEINGFRTKGRGFFLQGAFTF